MNNIQQLRSQNKKLKELKTNCQDELQKLKEVGRTHQNEIDTLLKFNQRLLGIIQNQFNGAAKAKITSDLQIISEDSEANNDFTANNKLKQKLASPPRMGNGFRQQEMDGFEDDQEEQEIYNQDAQSPQNSPMISSGNNLLQVPNSSKLDRVFEMQHKDEQISINLSNSVKNSNPTSSVRNHGNRYSKNQGVACGGGGGAGGIDVNLQLQQLKEMIKEYKQQFVDNSAEYQQICEIIHNDLLGDLQQFKKIQQQSQQFYRQKMQEVTSLRNQIKRFKPVNELIRVMKKLQVSPQTEKILQQKIISKQM